jgi:LCP family protein required for cell wall assembly
VSAPSDGASPPQSDADPGSSRSQFGREPVAAPANLLHDDLLASVQAEQQAPAPATKPPGGKRARRKRPRRTWPQRLLIVFNCFLVLVCFIAAGGMTYVKKQIADVKRIDLGGEITDQVAPGEPLNFLLVGIDNDFGVGNGDPASMYRDPTENTDTIMILRIDPSSHQAWIMSLQRDLYVPIAGTGSSGRINTALSIGGPGKLVETIKQDFGITINHYVQVNFAGFEQLVDALGGVAIYFPQAGRDTHSGLAPTGPGCVTLDGEHALEFARSRYYEIQTGPYTWVSDPSSDLGRVARQQEFIRAAMKKAIDRGARNPFTLSQLIGVAQKSVQLDYGVTTQTLLDLGEQFRDFDPDQLQVMQPPVTSTFVGAASVLLLNSPQAQPMFDIFRGVDPTRNLYKSVRVTVRSGGDASNRARDVRDQLAADGFTAQADQDPTYKSDTTVIKYAVSPNASVNPIIEVQAWVLARFIKGPVTVQQDPTITGDYPISLTVGSDWQGLRDINSPRPLSDFAGQLPPELAPAANQPATATTPPITLPPASVPADVPKSPPGGNCS